jgi:hypothetical protein
MILRVGKDLREMPVAEGSWVINCRGHLKQVPHEPLQQDGGVVCAPQFAMGFSGTSAYFITHLWYRGELPAVASELFRIRLDVEPKLRFVPNLGLMVMANMALAGARLPLSVQGDFRGDFNKWYPLYRQLPAVARVMKSRREVVRRAERFLKLRFADPPDPA